MVVLVSLKENQHHNQEILDTEYWLLLVLCSFRIMLLITILFPIYIQFHIKPYLDIHLAPRQLIHEITYK